MRIDASGEFFFTALGSVTGFIAGALTAMATESNSSKRFDLAVAGAAGGAIAGLGVDAGILLVSTLGMSTPVALTAFASAHALGGVGNVYTTHESTQISGTELESAQYLGTFIIGGAQKMQRVLFEDRWTSL